MFYENTIDNKNLTYKRYKYSFKGVNTDKDPNLLDFDYSPISCNFNYSSESLQDGIGVENLKFKYQADNIDAYKILDAIPNGGYVEGCWLFNSWDKEMQYNRTLIIIYSSYGDIYYNALRNDGTAINKIDGLNFTTTPMVSSINVDGVDKLLLVSSNEGMYTWEYLGNVEKIEGKSLINSMCVHNGKLYISTLNEKQSILYSDTLDPFGINEDLTQTGKIEFNDNYGRCNKIIVYNEYLYIIRDFNITKLLVESDGNYLSDNLYVSGGKIYENTVSVCGNKLVYLSSDGLNICNGSSTKKINLSIDSMMQKVDNNNAVGKYCNGYYYLGCKLSFGDGEFVQRENKFKNNALIRIDIDSGNLILLRGYEIIDLFEIKDIFDTQICVLIKETDGGTYMGIINMSGKYFDKSTTKVWRSPSTDLGYPDKDKFIKSITIETSQDIVVQIIVDDNIRNIQVKGRSGYQDVKVNMKGKKVQINYISESSNNYISNPQILFGY